MLQAGVTKRAMNRLNKINFFNSKILLISIPTIYLSYSYNPVATNTNLRAVTLVYPCSGLNIDSYDVTDSPELKHGNACGFIKFVNIIGNNIKQDLGVFSRRWEFSR